MPIFKRKQCKLIQTVLVTNLILLFFQKCKYCKLSQATVGCSVSSCKFSFHYPCGIENGVLFQFINNYESYCKKHRPEPVMPAPESTRTCPICYCDFKDEKYPIKPPCCNKDEVFHRKCMMVRDFLKNGKYTPKFH